MKSCHILGLAGSLALAACTHPQVAHVGPPMLPQPQPAWKTALSPIDRDRLSGLPLLWAKALAGIPARSRSLVSREGELLQPDAARDRAALPPGSYRCRLVKLGAAGREPAVRTFPENFCYVGSDAGQLTFTKQTGSELPGGRLYDDGDHRLVLVGARQRAAGDTTLAYSTEPERDLVGVVERTGPFRWRLVLPWREGGPGLDIYALTPVPASQQPIEPRAVSEPDIVVQAQRKDAP